MRQDNLSFLNPASGHSAGEDNYGQIIYQGKDLVRMSDQEIREFRWNDIAMVFQAAQNSLNPVIKIRDHFLRQRRHTTARSPRRR